MTASPEATPRWTDPRDFVRTIQSKLVVRLREARGGLHLRHVGVLDGCTLTMVGDLRTRGGSTNGAKLVLRFTNGSQAHEARLQTAWPTDAKGGVAPLNAAITLGEQVGGLPLTVGSWIVSLMLESPSKRRRLEIWAQPSIPPGGPTLWNPRSPHDGRRYKPIVTSGGQLRMMVQTFPPHAEIERVDVQGLSIRFAGRVVAIPAPDGICHIEWTVDEEILTTTDVQIENGRFQAEVPLERFTRVADEPIRVQGRLHLGNERLPLAKYLDDARNINQVMRLPSVKLASNTGTGIRFKPRFEKRRFEVDCRSLMK